MSGLSAVSAGTGTTAPVLVSRQERRSWSARNSVEKSMRILFISCDGNREVPLRGRAEHETRQ
jgi:diaminopimelate epimerase